MKSQARFIAVVLPLLLAGGCIVGDELTTMTVHPDGSVDLIVFRSNLRSTEKGEQAASEVAEYQTKFDARTSDDFVSIRDAGGKVLEALWVRTQVPMASVIHAHLPNAAALEKYATTQNADDVPRMTTRFQRDGSHRKLAVEITMPADKLDSIAALPADIDQQMQEFANGISGTRIAVTRSTITAARGFTVAEDKQSALLDVRKIAEMLRQGQGRTELTVEWEVAE